jgi:hypothetical protein
MGKVLLRAYSMSDSDMLTETKTKLEIAKQDINKLQSVEPSLTLAEIEAKIVEVDECINDYSSLESNSIITITTQNLQSIMQECREEVQVFFFHCERALSDKVAASIKFGRKGVETARNNPEKMVNLLNLIIANYSNPEYEDKLDARLTKGYKDKLVSLNTRLTDAIAAQSLAKTSRPAYTEIRIAKYNAVWSFARNICEIAKVAFRGSYAKQQQYFMYDRPATKKGSSSTLKEASLPAQKGEQA